MNAERPILAQMRTRTLAAVLASAALATLPRPASAQIVVGEGDASRYDALYGKPVDVSIDDLVQESAEYENRAVRTHGRLDMLFDGTQKGYGLKGLMYEIRVAPVTEVQTEWEQESMKMLGRDVEVTGVFLAAGNSQASATGQPMFGIQFWNFTGPPEKEPTGEIKSTQVTLEKLVSSPGKRDGQTIRVVGKFRGRNLYGDLPAASERQSADWVIKDDLYAVWVTGKKPKGAGWELDNGLKRDTLTTPPSATAEAKPPSPPPEKPKKPPVVVFALPLDGEAEVSQDSRFVVQFSKDMDENTFAGHVLLRYTGPVLPGDRAFDAVRLSYDRGLRALTVDPGDVLRPRRQIELLLLPGISDIDGLDLVSRAPATKGDIVDVLRYRVGS
jgi:Big-like domain-containing protein